MSADERSSKEKILKKVRKALLQKGEVNPDTVDMVSDVFVNEIGEPIEVFAGNLSANKGAFTYCFNEYDFLDSFLAEAEKSGWSSVLCLENPIRKLFSSCDFEVLTKPSDVKTASVGLTGCDVLVARTGSVIVSSAGNSSRTASIFPPVHVVVAYRDQVVYDLRDYLSRYSTQSIPNHPSMFGIISGPSRTSDIEKTLVLGAHGPMAIHVFYIDQDKPL
jgi:L-lactate dehydrogenase complex protein LldG